MKKENLPSISSFFNGQTQTPTDPTGEWITKSPARADFPIARCLYSYSQIDAAVGYAHAGMKTWGARPLIERKKILQKMTAVLLSQKEMLLVSLQEELGRSEADTALEWNQLVRWMRSFDDFKPDARDPRGVTAIVGSYVWPIFYTTHFAFLNLLAGNTVVIKPSEKATLSIIKWAQALISAAPEIKEALHVLVGEKELSRRLTCHELVNTVIFNGAFEAGLRIKQDTLSQTSKEVLMFLGAKNAAIVCEDPPAKMDAKLIQDVFLSTGQHCRSVSVIFIHDAQFKKFTESFHSAAREFKIGPPMSKAYAGPLIDESMLDRYLKFTGISEREGGEIIMRGKPLTQAEKGFYVTPTLVAFDQLSSEQMKKSVSLQNEILSPHVSLIRFQEYGELVELFKQLNYGLAASIWSENAERAHKIGQQLAVGDVSINQSLLEWDPAESFQARKKSGNHAYHGFKIFEQVTMLKSIK